MTIRAILGLAAAAVLATAAAASAQQGMEHRQNAVLQGLDKVTARVAQVEVPVGTTHRFGSLQITPRACRKAPPMEPPESAAFLEIQEVRPNEEPAMLFSGWMFASNPALSALEHPVYDVWVVDCK